MPQIILQHPGQPVASFSVSGATVIVAGVTVDCAARQANASVVIEIRTGATGAQEGGSGAYLAHVAIPPKRYNTVAGPNDAQGHATTVQELIALDPNTVQITLWPTA